MAKSENLDARWARLSVPQQRLVTELVRHTQAGIPGFSFVQEPGEVGLRSTGGIRSLQGRYPKEDLDKLEAEGLIQFPYREDGRRVIRAVRVTPDGSALVAFVLRRGAPGQLTATPNRAGKKRSKRASKAEENGQSSEPWNTRLKTARENANLSRPQVALALKKQDVQITPEAIKKHESGKAKPRPKVRAAYAAMYSISEDVLFAGC